MLLIIIYYLKKIQHTLSLHKFTPLLNNYFISPEIYTSTKKLPYAKKGELLLGIAQ